MITIKSKKYYIEKIAKNTDQGITISVLYPKNCCWIGLLYINYGKIPVSIYKKLFIIIYLTHYRLTS